MPHPQGIEPTTLALCFYRYSLQQAQGFPHGLSYDFGTNFLNIIPSETRVFLNFFPLQDSNPGPPLVSTVNDLKAEGPLSESFCGVQLEVGQSAVVKPPFERE